MKNKVPLKFITCFLLVALASCNSGGHVHTFSDSWESDETYHWHPSTCGHDVVDNKEEHHFVGDRCSICGYVNQTIEEGFVVAQAPFYVDEYDASFDDYVAKKEADVTYAYYTDEPQIIYMSLEQALEVTFKKTVHVTPKVNGVLYTIDGNNTPSFLVDYQENTVLAKDYSWINYMSWRYDSPLGLIDEITTTAYTDNNLSIYDLEKDVLFDIGDYNLDIINENGQIYIPFSIINYMILNPFYFSPVIFNGSGFYLLDMVTGAYGLEESNTRYAKQVRSTNLYQWTTKSKRYLENNYYSLLFNLDYFYGFRDQRFVNFGPYLDINHNDIVSGLKSNDETTYCRSVEKLINVVIGDGHTVCGNISTLFGDGTYDMTNEQSDRIDDLYDKYSEVYYKKYFSPAISSGLRYSGNTAFISFNSFAHSSIEFNPDNIDSYADEDSFALFHASFEDVKEHPEIENVVFDVTTNGGGDTNALIPMLGFLTDTVQMEIYNPLTEQTAHLAYRVDTNLDGKYDLKDNYKDKYNFFVLTSGYSFSCANAFPHICKEYNLATIIGQKSGGGSCAVYFTSTPDGMTFRLSSYMRFKTSANELGHYDDGVPVDYELDLDHFFDDEYISNFVSSIHN